MSNLGVMVAEIREELRRSGMDNAIKRGICAAILFHRDKRFKWNELSFTFSTVANQPTYDESDDANIGRLASIDSMRIVSPEIELGQRDINWMRERVNQATGTPSDFAYYEEMVYLDPIPASALSISVLGLLELKDTTQSTTNQIVSRDNILSLPDSYSTAWFTDGFEIIKAWAKGYVSLHHLRNKEQSDNMFGAAVDLRTDQEGQLAKLGASGFVRPTSF